jgi:hypothetical protein
VLTTASAPSPSSSSAARPSDDFGVPRLAPGPIVVTGYPHVVTNGMNDPAEWFGWSKDGEAFGYCYDGMPDDPNNIRCELVHHDGMHEARSCGNPHTERADPAKLKATRAFITENGFDSLQGAEGARMPPPLKGTWAFPDITLSVARMDPSRGDDAQPTGAVVRVGGSVDGEAPVYPITLSLENNPDPALPPQFAAMNGIALSPDGSEIGLCAHFFCMEWADYWTLKRLKVGALASVIYNDLGFRHHQRKEWARAAALFAKAAAADPEAKLPPYNLACALSREHEPAAERALRVAVARGGEPVKARARKDADFADVKREPWFVGVVGD